MLAIITRHSATDLPKMLLALWLLLSVPASSLNADTNLELVPVQPPTALFTSPQPLTDSEWYRLDLPPVAEEGELVVFSQVPARQLDVFIPVDGSYLLKKMSADSTESSTSTIRIPPGDAQTWYMRHAATPLAPLQPQLMPSSLYTQELNQRRVAINTVQTLLIAALITTVITLRKTSSRPLFNHILATVSLLFMWQGDVFHLFPWPGEPVHWVMFMATLALITGLGCYRRLLLTNQPIVNPLVLALNVLALVGALYGVLTHTPAALTLASTILLVNACLLILACVKSRFVAVLPLALTTTALGMSHFSPVNLPSLQQLLLLSVHAALLPLIYWFCGQTVTTINTSNDIRRVFTSTLREHLHNPDTPLNVADLKQRILATVESVLTGAPVMILHYQKDQWHITPSDGAGKISGKLNRRLPAIEANLFSVITSDHQINFKDGDGTVYWLFPLSIAADDKVLLALALPRRQRTDGNWQIACDISSHASTVFQANRQSLFWQREASLDTLTGTLNRRAFYREAETILHQCSNEPCSVLFIDLDNFKQLNDQLGHSAGDEALKYTATLCRRALRQEDLLGRYGGEEFVALLPNTTPMQAFQVAERIRKTIAQRQKARGVSVSIGVAAGSCSLDKLVTEADAAMYQAKRLGKNKTAFSPLLMGISEEPV